MFIQADFGSVWKSTEKCGCGLSITIIQACVAILTLKFLRVARIAMKY